jgi:Mg-chelatase subunit ChlD
MEIQVRRKHNFKKEGNITMSEKGIEIIKHHEDKGITFSKQGLEIRREGKPICYEMSTVGSVYLVIDCSGSMEEENKLNQAKRGAMNFANEARSKGYLTGLIKFDSSATHLCEPVREPLLLERHLESIEIGGSTNMAEAIHIASQRLRSRSGLRIIVIVTDGMPDSKEKALYEAEQAKKARIDIITIGTDDADRDFLSKLASRTELGMKVSKEELEQSIASSVKMLPGKTEPKPIKKTG